MLKIGVAFVAAVVLSGATHAAPRLEFKGAALRVVVIPEARADIQPRLVRSSRQFPLHVRQSGQVTIVDGGFEQRVHGCPTRGGAAGVRIRGIGNLRGSDLPVMVVRTPMDVKIRAGDGVTGIIGRARSVELDTHGCGVWTIANVAGPLQVSTIGSVDVHAGRAAAADLSVAGVGVTTARQISGSLTAISSGDGVISVDTTHGPVVIRVAGAGGVNVGGGKASSLNASVAGSGAIRFGGEATGVNASVTGPGLISVHKAVGPATKRSFGSGEVLLGR